MQLGIKVGFKPTLIPSCIQSYNLFQFSKVGNNDIYEILNNMFQYNLGSYLRHFWQGGVFRSPHSVAVHTGLQRFHTYGIFRIKIQDLILHIICFYLFEIFRIAQPPALAGGK